MNDEQFLLANAYLDGELTADERRIAEADPAVMAEVERLRAVQAQVRAVDPPSDAARERAVSAAMAEFRSAAATAAATTVAPRQAPVPFKPRPAYARYLAIAAAVVAVGMLGVIVSQAGLGGGDDDDAGADFAAEPAEDLADEGETAATVTADVDDAVVGAERAVDESAAEDGGDSDAPLEVMAEMAEETAEAVADDGEDAGGAAEEPGDAAADEPPPFAASPPDFDPDQPVTEPIELGAFGRYLLDEEAAGRLGSTPNTACPPELNILGTTTYVVDDEALDVFVGVLEAERAVVAIERDSCAVVLDGPLTEPTED